MDKIDKAVDKLVDEKSTEEKEEDFLTEFRQLVDKIEYAFDELDDLFYPLSRDKKLQGDLYKLREETVKKIEEFLPRARIGEHNER